MADLERQTGASRQVEVFEDRPRHEIIRRLRPVDGQHLRMPWWCAWGHYAVRLLNATSPSGVAAKRRHLAGRQLEYQSPEVGGARRQPAIRAKHLVDLRPVETLKQPGDVGLVAMLEDTLDRVARMRRRVEVFRIHIP